MFSHIRWLIREFNSGRFSETELARRLEQYEIAAMPWI